MSILLFLLAHPSPILRYLVLKNIYNRGESDSEISEIKSMIHEDVSLRSLISLQEKDGSWNMVDVRWGKTSSKIITTSIALSRLSYFGFSKRDNPVKRAAEYLFSVQKRDGSWNPDLENPEEEVDFYEWIPIKTAIPLRGLASCGYAGDKRCELAYDWLMDKQLKDGAWPTGWVQGNYGYVAGYRKMSHSRWGCRTNTTSVLICTALHPKRRKSKESAAALDLLLGRETEDVKNIGFDTARTLGFEPIRGLFTFFARYDPLLTLWLCRKIGADFSDERVEKLYNFIKKNIIPEKLFIYTSRPEASKWVHYQILHILKDFPLQTGWQSLQPRTPFQAYSKINKRF